MARLRHASLALLLLALAARAGAVMQMRNLTISPEFLCAGQTVTLTWETQFATAGGDQFWGVISTNNASWEDASDYLFLGGTKTNGTTAANTAGVPFAGTLMIAGPANDGFFHTVSFTTVIPAGYTGTNATFIIKGLDGGLNWMPGLVADAFLSVTIEQSCTKKAVYNHATLWEQEAVARLVIQQPVGTPSSTQTATPSATPTLTSSLTSTRTATSTATPTRTATPSHTPSPSPSDTPSSTPTRTATPTFTATPSVSFTRTVTPSATDTITPGPTPTYTHTFTVTSTSTATPTSTPTWTQSFTYTVTDSRTATPSSTATYTVTPTYTITTPFSPTATPTWTPTYTITVTPSATSSFTQTVTQSDTYTVTATRTATQTVTATPTLTGTRTITLTPTESFTFTVSPTITPTPIRAPYQIRINAYNSAGERVRSIYDGSMIDFPLTMGLSGGLGSPVNIDLGGRLKGGATSLQWDGDNDQAQALSSGVYTVKAEIIDPFGKVTALEQSVAVLKVVKSSMVTLFNSAGEAVRHWNLGALGVEGFDLTEPRAGISQVKDTAGGVYNLSVDGLGDDGRRLDNGSYTLVLSTEGPSGNKVVSRQFALLSAGGDDPLASAAPDLNPLPLGAAKLVIRYQPQPGAGTPSAGLYNLAGECVARASDPLGNGQLVLPADSLAGGIYLARLQVRNAQGRLCGRTLKIAVLK